MAELQDYPLDQLQSAEARIEKEMKQSWRHTEMVIAAIGCILLPVLGVPAMIICLMGYSDFVGKDYIRAKCRRKCALKLGIAAIVIGILIILVPVTLILLDEI